MTILKTTLKVAAGLTVGAAVGVAAYTIYEMMTEDNMDTTPAESDASEALGEVADAVKEQINAFLRD